VVSARSSSVREKPEHLNVARRPLGRPAARCAAASAATRRKSVPSAVLGTGDHITAVTGCDRRADSDAALGGSSDAAGISSARRLRATPGTSCC
jgi:hypothetical protein